MNNNYNYFLKALFIFLILTGGVFINYYLAILLSNYFNIDISYKLSLITFNFPISLAILLTLLEIYIIYRIIRYIKNNKDNYS